MTASKLHKTPLNHWHRTHGGRMTDFGGWDMPVHYASGILQEHLATRGFAGLFDVSHMGRFRIKGQKRIAFLQHVLSNNAEALDPWQAQYSLIPNRDGGVIDDTYLYRFGQDDYLLVVNAANRQKDWDHLRREAEAFPGVTLEDHTERLAMIALQGPLAGRMLPGLIQAGRLPEPSRNQLARIITCGADTLISRTGYTGEPVGFELFIPAERVEEVWTALLAAGTPDGLLPAGLGARDTLRLEAGLPLYGQEFGLDPDGKEFPAFAMPMASIGISFSPRKGDFIGREALAKQFEKVQKLRLGTAEPSDVLPRRVRPMALLDRGVVRRGAKVFIGQQQVGMVTSGTMIPYWQFDGEGATMHIGQETERRSIALAYVDALLRPETEVKVEVRDRRLRAQIVRWHGRSEAPPYFHAIPIGWQRPERALPVGRALERARHLVQKSLDNHLWRQQRCINLIPSEMTPSPLVRLLQVSDPVGRYAEHKELLAAFEQDVYYYQGTDFIAWVEQQLTAELAEFLGCSLIEARLVSGQMANTTVFSALVDYRNRDDRRREPGRIRLVINNHISRGGHLSAQPMGALKDFVAKDPVSERFAVVAFPIREDNPYRIDVDELAGMLDRLDPEVLIFGKSMVLHPEPVAEVRRLVADRRPRPLIMYDMAHVLGLVGPHFQEPFREGADIVTGSTHKTFFGTQRGIIAADFPEEVPEFALWKSIRRRAFPGAVSNHHLGTLLGLLLATIELRAFRDDYQRQVIANAKAFARALADEGLGVEGDPAVDFTETHQVIVRVGYAQGCQVARKLEEANIICNYQAIPGDEGFTSSSGLRMGVAEMTRFGMKEDDFRALAPLLAEAIRSDKNLADQVARFRQGFLQMQYCLDDETLKPLKTELLATF